MELGISTVVMLVIAIVIIGAGIVFIRGFFDEGTGTLVGAFNVADFGLDPTSSNPLVLTDGLVNIKTGSNEVVRIGFYNKHDGMKNISIAFGNCVTMENTSTACGVGGRIRPIIIVLPLSVEVGAQAGFSTQVQAICASGPRRNLPAGTYSCNLEAFTCDNLDACIYNENRVIEREQFVFNIIS